MLKNTVRELAESKIAPKVLQRDERGEFPFDLVKEIGKIGLIGLVIAKEYGGSGMGHLARLITIEEISRIYPSLGFFLQTGNLFMYALDNFGSEEQKKKLLPDLCQGMKVASLAVTEPGGGSDPSGTMTAANPEGDGYMVNGRKTYISLAGVADAVGFLAKTGDSFSIFFVEKGTPGFEITRREAQIGFRSLPISEIVLTNCRLSKENLIGQEGRGMGAALTAISVMGRTGAAGIALGAAQGAYEAALKFCKERVLYGQPIAKLQALQFMLADMSTEIEAARWLYYLPASLLDQGKGAREVGTEIARAKLYCVDMAIKNCTKAVQIMGGYGLSPEYEVERRLRDVLELLPAAGTQEIMRVTIGSAVTR
jgi:butyryl-CoA dehydrogenase